MRIDGILIIRATICEGRPNRQSPHEFACHCAWSKAQAPNPSMPFTF
jgi:hypothetical protein